MVTAQHRKKTEALEAAQVDKDESQSAVVTYSKHMNSIWGLAEPGMARDEELVRLCSCLLHSTKCAPFNQSAFFSVAKSLYSEDGEVLCHEVEPARSLQTTKNHSDLPMSRFEI